MLRYDTKLMDAHKIPQLFSSSVLRTGIKIERIFVCIQNPISKIVMVSMLIFVNVTRSSYKTCRYLSDSHHVIF